MAFSFDIGRKDSLILPQDGGDDWDFYNSVLVKVNDTSDQKDDSTVDPSLITSNAHAQLSDFQDSSSESDDVDSTSSDEEPEPYIVSTTQQAEKGNRPLFSNPFDKPSCGIIPDVPGGFKISYPTISPLETIPSPATTLQDVDAPMAEAEEPIQEEVLDEEPEVWAAPPPQPSLPRTPTSSRKRSRTLYTFDDEDEDNVDVPADDDDEDEYRPTPAPKASSSRPRKRARSNPTPRKAAASKSKASKPKTTKAKAPAKGSKPKGHRTPPGPRNAQADQKITTLHIRRERIRSKEWLICPLCDWRQEVTRSPDFNRHLQTHMRPDDDDETQGWWCKGILFSKRGLYGVPDNFEPYQFGGTMRVGGCLQTFSRRDALKRHLDNTKIGCYGHACSAVDDL